MTARDDLIRDLDGAWRGQPQPYRVTPTLGQLADHLLAAGWSRPRVVTTPGFLCVANSEHRTATILHTRDEVIDWLGREWFGQDPRNPEDQWVVDEVMAPVATWGDGVGELVWRFEDGDIEVTALGECPWEWADAGSPPAETDGAVS